MATSSTAIVINSDDEDDVEVPMQRTLRPMTIIENGTEVTLLDIPPPVSRNNAVKPAPILSPIPRRARQSLPIQPKASPTQSSPSRKSRRITLDNNILSLSAKFPPPSASQKPSEYIDIVTPSPTKSPGELWESDVLKKATSSSTETAFQAEVEAGQRAKSPTPLSQVGGSLSISPSHRLIVEDAEDDDGDNEDDDDPVIPPSPRAVVEDAEDTDEQEEVGPGDRDTPSKPSFRADPDLQTSFDHSIGTDSPLVRYRKRARLDDETSHSQRDESPREVMAWRSISTEHQSDAQLDLDHLEEALVQLRQRVGDDHAETVKWLLHDAKRASDGRKSAFMDKVSPFASMTPVKAPPGPAPDGMTKLRLDTYASKKKAAKSSAHFLTTKLATNVPRVPKYSSLTIVKRNILCPDDEQLKFMPFLADSNKDYMHKRLLKELEEAYSARRLGSDPDSELASQLSAYLDSWLEELDLGLDRQALTRYILDEDSDSLGKTQREIRLLTKASGSQLSPSLAAVASNFAAAFNTVFKLSITAVVLPDERLNDMLEKASKSGLDNSQERSQSESPMSQNSTEHKDERLETYTHLTCLICGVIACQTHGTYRRVEIRIDDDSEMSELGEEPEEECKYNHHPVNMEYQDILRKQNARLSQQRPETATSPPEPVSVGPPCSDECYRTVDFDGHAAEMEEENLVALKSFMVSMRPENGQPCDIAFLLNLRCWEVHIKMQELKSYMPRISPSSPLQRSPKKEISWYNNKTKTLKSDWRTDWRDSTIAHMHEKRTQATACSHDGPCTGECPCASSTILCETYCGCPDDCPRRFTGCNCHASGKLCTSSDSCICLAMNRECGPRCFSCGAIPRTDPRNKYDDDLFNRGCQNIVLQRGVNRKLMIGESQLDGVGFGLYLCEPVHKGDYLGEYAGEVISSQEAERRGIIYDRKYLSFLFDLNQDWVIDAARFGNKTRFINHAESESNGLNCEAKVMLVNGEHRIKFFALKDIKAGEELLFNYGKKFAEKQGLNKKLPKAAKEGRKKGVIIGEEALEALEGNRTRGKFTAIRGGHSSGRGGRKATKSAPMKQMRALIAELEEADEDETMLDADQVDEEDDDEDDIYQRRAKRQIRRPMRYTR